MSVGLRTHARCTCESEQVGAGGAQGAGGAISNDKENSERANYELLSAISFTCSPPPLLLHWGPLHIVGPHRERESEIELRINMHMFKH